MLHGLNAMKYARNLNKWTKKETQSDRHTRIRKILDGCDLVTYRYDLRHNSLHIFLHIYKLVAGQD